MLIKGHSVRGSNQDACTFRTCMMLCCRNQFFANSMTFVIFMDSKI